MSSFQTYLLGFIVLVIGLALAAYLAGVEPLWIVVGVIILIGIGIIAATNHTKPRDPPSPPQYRGRRAGGRSGSRSQRRAMPQGIWSEYPVQVVWEGGMRYRGGRPDGPTLVVDGGREVAPSPVEAMLVALGACSAIDVVEVLQKRRTPPTGLEVRVDFARAESPPRRLTSVRLLYQVAADSERHHVERAVALSFEKYCSVAHSLAPDVEVAWELDLQSAGGASATE